jgi:hypothetical protein
MLKNQLHLLKLNFTKMLAIYLLAIYLFIDFWLQIWFQKYCISPYGTQFPINKDKNRGKFLFTFPPMGVMRGSVLPRRCATGLTVRTDEIQTYLLSEIDNIWLRNPARLWILCARDMRAPVRSTPLTSSVSEARHCAQSNDLLPLRASPRASAKVPGRLVERHYSLMSFSTNVPAHGPVREGTA